MRIFCLIPLLLLPCIISAQTTPTRISQLQASPFDEAIQNLTACNGRLFFVGRTTAEGAELYTSDGQSTSLIADFCPGAGNGVSAIKGRLAVANNQVYFPASAS